MGVNATPGGLSSKSVKLKSGAIIRKTALAEAVF